MIVIIGSTKQYQVESVAEKLTKLGRDVEVIDFLRNTPVSLCREHASIAANGRPLNGAKIVYHDPKYLVSPFGDTEEWLDEYIVSVGSKWANNNFSDSLPGLKLNPLRTVLGFHAKLSQLFLAEEVGLDVPDFVCTNDRKVLLDFCRSKKSVITKDVGNGNIPHIDNGVGARSVMTSPVSEKMILETEGNQPFPILLQENIVEKFEYRIVAAGREVLGFRIDPNRHPIMQQDYRRGGYMVDYVPIEIERGIKEGILRLSDRLGLFSGSYDRSRTMQEISIF